MNRFLLLALLFVLCVACHHADVPLDAAGVVEGDLSTILKRGELRVVMLEGTSDYFIEENEAYGHAYAMVNHLADYLGVRLRVIPANNEQQVQTLLTSGKADMAACYLPCSHRNRALFDFAENLVLTQPMLVQRAGQQQIQAPIDLIGKTVTVHRGSKYYRRLQQLNYELGGGIMIADAPSTLSVEELVYEVAKGDLEYTIADADVLDICRYYVRNIDASVALGVAMPKAWAVRKGAHHFIDTLSCWRNDKTNASFFRRMRRYAGHRAYFENLVDPIAMFAVPQGHVSPYDSIFKECARQLGWDWRLLAALAWTESHFNPKAMSYMGAVGIMQLMPSTARKYGLDSNTIIQPEPNIRAGVAYLKRLSTFFDAVSNIEERAKFVIAAYNAGCGHVLDAMALAEKYGADPYVWSGSVDKFLQLKSDPLYYNDSICRYGYFRANHTMLHVNNVYKTYVRFKGHR